MNLATPHKASNQEPFMKEADSERLSELETLWDAINRTTAIIEFTP